MSTRTSTAQWQGDLRGGSGTMRLGSGAYTGAFSYASRFEDGAGTNPEELIAAAHAGCFSMALSNMLAEAGYNQASVRTSARVHLELPTGITRIELSVVGDVPNLDEAEFVKYADQAKTTCPVSKALSAIDITLKARYA